MPEWSQTDADQSTDSLSRRRLLTASAATAATVLVGATGTAAADQETGRFNDAPGRGGQAVTPAADFREKAFHITERTGDTATEIDGALFSCNEATVNRSSSSAGFSSTSTTTPSDCCLPGRTTSTPTKPTPGVRRAQNSATTPVSCSRATACPKTSSRPATKRPARS